jgi:HEAT repeat protein
VSESGHGVNDDSEVQGSHADLGTISSLVAELSKEDGAARQRARHSLVAIGAPAVASLIEALASRNELLRWEAAKALGDIRDPVAAPALVAALEDEVFDVRWLAAKGLIALRSEGLVPLLQALLGRSDSLWLREGAHHVFHDLVRGRPYLRDVLRPVLAALEDVEPSLEVPIAAEAALEKLIRGEA